MYKFIYNTDYKKYDVNSKKGIKLLKNYIELLINSDTYKGGRSISTVTESIDEFLGNCALKIIQFGKGLFLNPRHLKMKKSMKNELSVFNFDNPPEVLMKYQPSKLTTGITDDTIYTFLFIDRMNNSFDKFKIKSIDSAIYFTKRMLQGMLYLNKQNLAHNDIKPGNILVKDLLPGTAGDKIYDHSTSRFSFYLTDFGEMSNISKQDPIQYGTKLYFPQMKGDLSYTTAVYELYTNEPEGVGTDVGGSECKWFHNLNLGSLSDGAAVFEVAIMSADSSFGKDLYALAATLQKITADDADDLLYIKVLIDFLYKFSIHIIIRDDIKRNGAGIADDGTPQSKFPNFIMSGGGASSDSIPSASSCAGSSIDDADASIYSQIENKLRRNHNYTDLEDFFIQLFGETAGGHLLPIPAPEIQSIKNISPYSYSQSGGVLPTPKYNFIEIGHGAFGKIFDLRNFTLRFHKNRETHAWAIHNYKKTYSADNILIDYYITGNLDQVFTTIEHVELDDIFSTTPLNCSIIGPNLKGLLISHIGDYLGDYKSVIINTIKDFNKEGFSPCIRVKSLYITTESEIRIGELENVVSFAELSGVAVFSGDDDREISLPSVSFNLSETQLINIKALRDSYIGDLETATARGGMRPGLKLDLKPIIPAPPGLSLPTSTFSAAPKKPDINPITDVAIKARKQKLKDFTKKILKLISYDEGASVAPAAAAASVPSSVLTLDDKYKDDYVRYYIKDLILLEVILYEIAHKK